MDSEVKLKLNKYIQFIIIIYKLKLRFIQNLWLGCWLNILV